MGLLALLHRPQSYKGAGSDRPAPDIAAPAAPGVVTFERPGGPIADHLEVLDPGQIGAGSMAGAHVGSTMAPGAAPDPRRQQYVQTVGDALIPPNPRAFRAREAGRNAATTDVPFMDPGGAVLDTPAHEVPNGYWVGTNAVPDPRRVWQDPSPDAKPAGYPLAEVRPSAELQSNDMGEVGYLGSYDEQRPRAGAAQPEEGRPAMARPYLFTRAFDKIAADTLTGQKGVFRSPVASTPPSDPGDIESPFASPGGRFGARGLETIIAPSANTFRQAPAPYDQTLVDAGQPYSAAAVSGAGRGWRAR